MFQDPPAEVFVPNERALAALADPLRTGQLLQPVGPVVRLDMISDSVQRRASSPASTASESPNALRPPVHPLLDAASTRHGWREVAFRLVDGIKTGHPRCAQLWRAEAEIGGQSCGRVVVKLFADALWPLPHDQVAPWRPLERRVGSEMQAYASLRPVQGRDVAHCYGAHDFEMPWGDVVVGIVLEDLGEVAKPLVEWCEREKPNLRTLEAVHEAISASLHCLHRLHRLDVGVIEPRRHKVLVLDARVGPAPSFVFLGFSWSESFEEGRRRYAVDEPDVVYRWCDECLLIGSWSCALDEDLYYPWTDYCEEQEPGLIAWYGQREPSLVEDLSDERARALC